MSEAELLSDCLKCIALLEKLVRNLIVMGIRDGKFIRCPGCGGWVAFNANVHGDDCPLKDFLDD